MIIPQAQNKNYFFFGRRIIHPGKSTALGKRVLVAKGFLLGNAEIRDDRVAQDTVDEFVGSEEGFVDKAEGVEFAAVGIAVGSVAVVGVGSAAVVSVAHGLFKRGAGVSC